MKFGSVCSGIEAASVAWEPLGWEAAWLSEIEPFPCAVLKHHYPDVPNYGDMTLLPEKILSGQVEAPDLFCGGTPCQAFSVAGLRKSLDDERGNLSLTFCEIADAIDTVRAKQKQPPCIVFWENVPGVLNTSDNAFGCFLAGLAGEDEALVAPGGRWTNAGFIDGPQRAVAWRVLDAQYFGVAQRRRRVFVVASARDGFDPAAVLFEFDGVRRDTAPSREAGQKPAPTVVSGPPFSRTGNERVECEAIVAATLTAGCGQRYDFETETMLPIALAENTIGRQPQNGGNGDGFTEGGPMYTLNATGVHGAAQPVHAFDARQSEVIQYGDMSGPLDTDGHSIGVMQPMPFGVGEQPELGHCLRAGASKADKHESTTYVDQPIAFNGDQSAKTRSMGESVDMTPTLRADGPCHVAAQILGGWDYENNAHGPDDVTGPLLKGSPTGGGRPLPAVALPTMAVRRLTPVECERLQGFPDNYTNIPWRNKTEAPDGPRYKALGNSWAVPVVRWIGERIVRALA